jgi:DNA-binding protein H-NS
MVKKRKKRMLKKQRKQNLSGLDFKALMDLSTQVESALSGYRSTLEKQLASIGGSVASIGRKMARGGRGSALKGTKVAAKYRGPGGETWAGRGATPRWLVAATKGTGKKVEDFLIDKAAANGRKKRKSKS